MPSTLEHKKELIFVLQTTDLKEFIVGLQDEQILSCDGQDTKSLLHSLEQDQVDPTLLAKFIVNRIPNELSEWLWGKYLKVLGNFKSTTGLRNALRVGSEGMSHVQVGQKRPLHEKEIVLADLHVPVMTSLLSKCSHKWEEIAIMLGLLEHVIEECRTGSSNMMRLYKVLRAWIRQDGESVKPATLQNMSDALSSELVSMYSTGVTLHDQFQERFKTQEQGVKKPRLSAQRSKNVVHDGMSTLLGVQSEYEENLEYKWLKNDKILCDDSNFSYTTEDVLLIRNTRQGLEGKYSCFTHNDKKVFEIELEVEFCPPKKKLLNMYSVLEAVPNSWPPIGTSTYIELALVRNQKSTEYDYSVRGDMDDILEKKDKIQYEKIFAEYGDRTLMIVEGRPGCGKTTLTHKISRDWAKGPDILKGAQYVFLIPLRLFSKIKAKSLLAVLNIIFRSENNSKAVADLLEKCDGKGACFVIDGLDEYPDRNDPTDIVHLILKKKCLPLAMVIVASRPAGTAELRQLAQKRIEVLGFSKTQILKYLKEYCFKTGEHSSVSLEDYLKKHENVYHMCYLPVHTAMICYIYDHNNGEVPNTETKIYNLFTLLTIKRKLCRDGDQGGVSELDKLRGNLKDSFSNVCKLAFDMTLSSKQAMFQSETENCLSDEIGSKVHSLGLVTIDSTAKLLGYDDLYAFLHLTFQEFLAAYHLSTLDSQDQLQLVTEHREKSDMKVVWKFFCGLVNFSKEESSILAQIMTTKSSNNLFRFQCALESQQKVVCDSSLLFKENGDDDGSVVIKDHTFLSIDLNAIGFTIANTSFLVSSLILDNCSLNSDGVQSLIEQVGPTKLGLIKSIQFSTNDETEQFEMLKILLSKLVSLEFLHLAGMELRSSNIKTLTNNIKLPNLKVLVIRMPLTQYSDMDSVHLLSFNSHVLKQVRYDYVDADHESHKTSLLNLLKHFSCEVVSLSDPPQTILCNLDVDLVRVPSFLSISTLLLVNCNIYDRGIRFLKDTGINNVETLRLDFNKITCTGAKLISECFKLFNRLRTLSVSCNLIGDVGALALSEALQTSSLLELDLQGNKIGNDGAIAIAKAVERCPSNFSLTIWNIKITPEGADKVLQYSPNARVKNQHEIYARRFIITNSPDAMTRAVSCCTNLVSLDCSGRSMTRHAAEAFATGIKVCTYLKSLNLEQCGLSFKVLQQLGEGLKNCRNLASINFGCNGIQSRDISRLLTPLKLCPSLQELDLHDNPLKYAGIDSLTCQLSRCPLKSLNLCNTKIDQYGAALLAKYLRLGACRRRISCGDLFVDQEPFSEFLLTHLNKGVKNIFKNRGPIHSWYTSLKVLDLKNNKINSRGAAALAYGIKYCTKLETLNISQNNIDASGASMLAHGFKSCLELKKLVLCNNPLKADGATSLFSALQCCHNLQVLYCQKIDLLVSNRMEVEEPDSCVEVKGIIALASALKFWINFTELDISRNDINCKGIIELAKGLKQVKHLAKLDISNNKIAADGMIVVSKSLESAHLTYLDLSNNSITHVGALAVSEILSSSNKIASLDISSTDIGTEGAEMLGNGLRNCPELIEVYLVSNKIGSRGLKMLLDGLKNCTKLNFLNLSDNNIGSEGVKKLMLVLNYFCELKMLDLSKNNICIDGCRTIRNWLFCKQQEGSVSQEENQSSISCRQKFKSLYLADNSFGLDGALEIASGIQHCSNFQQLNLEGNNIGSAGAIQLGEKLKHCHNLRWVRLNNNQIHSIAAVELAKHLKCCTNLWRLDISQNLSIDLLALTNILRHCRIYSDYGWTSYDQEKRDRQHGGKRRNEDDWYNGGEIHLEGDGDLEQDWINNYDSEQDWIEDF